MIEVNESILDRLNLAKDEVSQVGTDAETEELDMEG